MEIGLSIIFVGVLVFFAHLFAWLFKFVRIPDVLLLMCIGILIGPLLNIVPPDFLGKAGDLVIKLILVMILFEGAIKLKFQHLRQAVFGTLSLTLISFLLTMAGVGLLLWQFAGFSVIPAFLIGAIVGGNAAAIVVPLIEKIKISEESRTTLFLESGISDVLSIVFAFALVASLEAGVFHIDVVVFDIVKTLIMAIVIGCISAFAWSLLLSKIHNIKNSAFTTPAFVFIIYGVTELLGFSGLVSIIFFGIVLGNIPLIISSLQEKHRFIHTILRPQPLSNKELSFFCEVVFLIKIFFFIFIGISLNFESTPILLLGLLLTIFILILRIPAVLLSIPRSTPKFDASVISVTIPRGLAAAVLALIPLQRGLAEGQFIQDITYSIIFFSVLFTSIFIFLLYKTNLRKLYELLLSKFTPNPEDGSAEYPIKNKE